VIPHANRLDAPTSAADALPIAVVEPTFGAHTMAAASAPKTLRASLGRAARGAIDVAAVAASADGEESLAARTSRQPQGRRREIHGQHLRSVPTRTRPTTLPGQKRATIRVGRACVPTKTRARPLEDSEGLLRVLTCFWDGRARVRLHAPNAATAGAVPCGHRPLGAARRGPTQGRARGVRPWVHDPSIKKIRI
jgi:hypothetical protein